jgi:hypothetical protein
MNATWLSQRVPALGAITAEGILNQLGRPEIDRLTVLVREAAQNSWDARDPGNDGPVRFEIDVRRLDTRLSETWRGHFGETCLMRGVPIEKALGGSEPIVMFVSDRGTTGLGGPTRADHATDPGEHDYVSFVLNVGDPRDTEFGGGTYGYGKSVFYAAARTRAVVVHSRCREGGSIQSRLVGIALGTRHAANGINYTGRHWWGKRVDDDHIEPIVDFDAEEIAGKLGFPSFDASECGTTIALLAPEFDGRSPEEAAEWIADAILWHLWPKMLVGPEGYADMRFAVSVDGAAVGVTSPADHRAIRLFSRALETLDRNDADGELLRCGNPKRDLGRLETLKTYEPPPLLGPVAAEIGFRDSVHHVCLLRTPRLVVEYRPGPPPMDEHVWYAGVYLARDDLDDVLAGSEPPTHDAWIPSQLHGRDKTLVKTTLRKIDERLRVFGAPTEIVADGPTVPLGAASRFLAGLLGDVTGQGADVESGGAGGSGDRRAVRLRGDPFWDEYDGSAVLAQRIEVETTRTVSIKPVLSIGLWGGGAEKDAPLGSSMPTFVAWRSSKGEIQRDAVIAFSPADNGDWDLLVRPVRDTVTAIGLASAEIEGDS